MYRRIELRASIGFLLLLLTLLMVLAQRSNAADVIAYVGEVGGSVHVENEQMAKSIDASLGLLLNPGDIVKTGEKSYASIIFQDDGSRVKLGENAQLTLNAKREKKSLRKRIFLGAGKLWARVAKKRGTDFQVKTPTSVASVKGTKFIIEETGNGVTWLWVLEDAVQLSNETGEVTVHEGEKGKATKEKIEVEPIVEEEIPIEPGSHSIIFYFNQKGGNKLQKELHIEFKR